MMDAGILSFGFFQNAIAAAVLASIACGIIGSLVVVRRMVTVSGGISHAAFGGVGLGYLFSIDPIVGAFIFSVGVALGIGILKEKAGQEIDTLIGAVWAAGMAVGIISVSLSGGYAPDLFSYLFGNILLVPQGDILLMAVFSAFIVAIVALFYLPLQAVTFDEEYARVMNLPATPLSLVLLVLTATSVVILIRLVGIILVIALLVLPAASVRGFTTRLPTMMAASVVLALVLSLSGLFLSYAWDLPSGATIILLGAAVYAAALVLSRFSPARWGGGSRTGRRLPQQEEQGAR
ncbi:MAG: metal ABC transporter permease [Methanolinea sp.]|nr:metal ABC transporter permease [Methanolinea sp.]